MTQPSSFSLLGRVALASLLSIAAIPALAQGNDVAALAVMEQPMPVHRIPGKGAKPVSQDTICRTSRLQTLTEYRLGNAVGYGSSVRARTNTGLCSLRPVTP